MTAEEILGALQAAIDARDAERLIGLFDDPAMLVGTGGDGRDRKRLVGYLTALTTNPQSLLWVWNEIVPFHESDGELGFAAFGEVVVTGESGERREPVRATILAVETENGWRVRQFHGSIPFVW